MSKDAYWFQHDSNAHNDDRIVRMRVRVKVPDHGGWAAFGLYWAVVGVLRDQDKYRLKDDENLIGVLSTMIGAHREDLEPLLLETCESGLFVRRNGWFFSPSLSRRMEKFDRKKEVARFAAETRWEGNANAMQTHCERTANAMPLDKTRVDKSREENTSSRKRSPFQIFMDQYSSEYLGFSEVSPASKVKAFYSRNGRAGRDLLAMADGAPEKAMLAVKSIGSWLDSKGLSWTLDTIGKHALEYFKNPKRYESKSQEPPCPKPGRF